MGTEHANPPINKTTPILRVRSYYHTDLSVSKNKTSREDHRLYKKYVKKGSEPNNQSLKGIIILYSEFIRFHRDPESSLG